MNLLEYEAKAILATAKLPVPRSVLITKGALPTVTLPTVLKSQVPIGGRGKLGGIRIVETTGDLVHTVDDLFALPIKDYTP